MKVRASGGGMRVTHGQVPGLLAGWNGQKEPRVQVERTA
jgi:hypothetical protein